MNAAAADDVRDVVVVGAGPAGLFATYYAGFRGLSVTLVDAQSEAGGQITALYPGKLIHDVGGFPAVTGSALVAGLLSQVKQYGPRLLFDTDVTGLERGEDGTFALRTSGRTPLRTRTVVLATGVGGIHPRRLPVGHEWHGRGVVYVVTDVAAHTDHDVVVVGGGDSALDWALALRPVARSVTIVHRRRGFRAHAALLEQAAREGVKLVTEAEVQGVDGDHRVRSVSVRRDDGLTLDLPADTIVGALGLLSAPTPFADWGLDVRQRKAVVDSRMQTSVPGIFAIGDASTYEGKVALIATGFGEAATAVNNAAVHIDPELSLMPGHSTDEELAPPSTRSSQIPVVAAVRRDGA
ncbi:MAG TPA: NAD(P)/FAD-dependent oxidoreductase [Propionicimonas sp.]